MFLLQGLVEIFVAAIFACLPALIGGIAGAAIGIFACGTLPAIIGGAVAGAALGWTYDYSKTRGNN